MLFVVSTTTPKSSFYAVESLLDVHNFHICLNCNIKFIFKTRHTKIQWSIKCIQSSEVVGCLHVSTFNCTKFFFMCRLVYVRRHKMLAKDESVRQLHQVLSCFFFTLLTTNKKRERLKKTLTYWLKYVE